MHLMAAKARVAPLKKMTIPRLELLAATIGARLWYQVKNALGGEICSHFWSDSTTVLSWIKRTEDWAVFVWNRTAEIRQLTNMELWRHVPGNQNPADLLSRGCSPKTLLESRWWEGPPWLYGSSKEWPQKKVMVHEEEINRERKKKANKTLLNAEVTERLYQYFSRYKRIVRMLAWMLRFINGCKKGQNSQGDLQQEEISSAEKVLLKFIQRESFPKVMDKILSSLNAFYDEEGLLRVRSRLTRRDDLRDFLYPYVLPKEHPVVRRLIFETHINSCHVGTQGLLSILRERFWILGGRRLVRSVINSCQVCKRHSAKRMQAPTPPLPINRVREAAVFEVVGIDLAGPLYLRGGAKVWICLFTCAIYRAVHLEMVTSLSTNDFLMTLRRFIARRGRPKFVYTDNGTNFRGTENLLGRLDWAEIQKESSVHRINWRFSPPSAPWWGGWWERLIGMLKQLLKKTLGRASLTSEETYTILCDCESVINSRPLTYMTNDPKDLVPLSPLMFLRDLRECGVPDIDRLDSNNLNKRFVYLQRLRNELRNRFRVEYLGLLRQSSKIQNCDSVSVGDVVLIGNDNTKRLDWPLGRIVETLRGEDGISRLVRVQTVHGQLLRPLQRLYPVECGQRQLVRGPDDLQETSEGEKNLPTVTEADQLQMKNAYDKNGRCDGDKSVLCSKSGRKIKRPKRYLC